MAALLLMLFLCYLVGSIPASLWAGHVLHGVDVRRHGSGNAGATNAFRVLGWRAGVVAMIVDLGKGLLAAGVIPLFFLAPEGLGLGVWEPETVMHILAGLAAVVGHIFPVWARFKGGKGVNTSAGVLFALSPVTTAIALGIFVVVLLSSRYVSLASLTAAIAFPSTVAIRRYVFGIESLDPSLLVFGILLGLAVIVAHRTNIERLLNGSESRIRSFRPARGMLGRGEI